MHYLEIICTVFATLFASSIIRAIIKNRDNVKLKGPQGQTIWVTRGNEKIVREFVELGYKVVN